MGMAIWRALAVESFRCFAKTRQGILLSESALPERPDHVEEGQSLPISLEHGNRVGQEILSLDTVVVRHRTRAAGHVDRNAKSMMLFPGCTLRRRTHGSHMLVI